MGEKDSQSQRRTDRGAKRRTAAQHSTFSAHHSAAAQHSFDVQHSAAAYQSASTSAYKPVSVGQRSAGRQLGTARHSTGVSHATSQHAAGQRTGSAAHQQGAAVPRQGTGTASHPATPGTTTRPTTPGTAHSTATSHNDLIKVRKKKKKLGKGPKIALTIAAVFLGLVLASAGALILWINSLESSMSLSEEDSQALSEVLVPVESEDDAFYMLILGSDARETDTASRSDVIMLVRVDPSTATVDLISIPRDTMVTIEGYGTQKINAAYAYGGAAGAVACVSEFAGVDISHYVEVHFEELEEVVDALGGIWVDIPEDIEAGNGGMAFSAGEQLLSGEQALALARERYTVTGGDFGRAQAQRLIVEALIERILSVAPAELPSIIGQLAESVSTDFSVADLVTLARQFMGEDMTIYSAACPSYTLYQDGISYVATMFDEWQAMMQRVDAGLDPEDEDAEIPEEQANNSSLGAATNSPAPRDYEELAASALTTDDVVDIE